MSSGEVRRVSRQDIQLVQNLIERCLQLYMNQKEVVHTLLIQAKIEPGFTELVWQKLEEENREFFKAYKLRLMVKEQIMVFNKLLEQQVELMKKIRPAGSAALPVSNGSHNFSVQQQQNLSCYSMEQTLTHGSDNMHHPMHPSRAIMNGGSSMHQSMRISDDTSVHSGTMDLSPNMLLAQNSGMDMLRGMNGMAIKSEPSYSNSPVYMFGADGNVLDSRPTVGEASAVSFNGTESNSQPLTESPLEADIGFLGQIPRNFSLSDLTAGFSQSSEILENYYRSPFLGTDADDFPDSPGNECQGENKRLDTISEGLSYEEFVTSD
ncbi:hypothetical protein AAC387_Pa01g1893 [Persea americana]